MAEEPEFGFQDAIDAHLDWKRRLINTVAGWSSDVLPRNHVETEHDCRLGQWLDGAGARRFGGIPSFGQLVRHHQEFHRTALRIIELAEGGKVTEAEDLLNGPFRESSSEVVALLRYLADLSTS